MATEHTRILIDYGVPLRRLERTLEMLQIAPDSIDAIFVTHEHGDHCRGLTIKHPFHVRYQIPKLYSAPRTCRRLGRTDVQPLPPGQPVQVGDFTIEGLNKCHDAVQPLAFLLRTGHHKIGVVTDLGTVSPGLLQSLRGCHHVIFESNHDEALERQSGRPYHLIQRVLGDRGHLSNTQAAGFLREIVTADTQSILLAHLSLDCNHPGLATETVHQALENTPFAGDLHVAPPDHPSGWIEVTATGGAADDTAGYFSHPGGL